ncbi:hypothetical protein QCA50_009013 [Cerrena zonata]|uniref:Fungal-type protein kinase domain-containing protein n=1 Tax=Cerrena zonata TaxID=2478898 RepID=A0AAW0G850_9APHY
MAWEMGLLHHDISFRNILLVYKSNSNHLTRALLVDWDSCNKENEIDRNRSGTWEFMSALQQRYPKKPYQVSDDIEGFVHIILWCAMRYLDHDYLEPGIFANLVEGMFKSRTHSIDGVLAGTGSPIKWHAVKGGHPPFHLSDEEQNL